MRLDKFLCEMNIGTRSRVKVLLKQGLVMVNGQTVTSGEQKIDENRDKVTYKGELLAYRKFHYYLLNKPSGVVTANKDNLSETVLDLLPKELRRGISPVGRLDKDTEGLLLLTDDGELAHRLLSPSKHVDKVYQVAVDAPLSEEQIHALEQGVDIGEGIVTKPAEVQVLDEKSILLTICEGKFHQVKRMLKAVGNEVKALKRVQFGSLTLDEGLAPGTYRELTEEEVLKLQNPNVGMMQGKEAVIFDLDGSLVDSMWIWKDIDIEYLGRFGIELPEKLQSEIEGMSFSETAVYFKERFGISDSIEQMKEDWNRMAWDKYMNEVPLKPGVLEFLKACREKKMKLGIATSNSRELVENIASAHNLRDYFSCIMTACEVNRGKPSPDIYLAVAEKLQVEPSKCLVFEDIIPGIQAGKSAGMKVCAVEDEYSAGDRLKKKRLADYYIDDFYGIFKS